MAIELLDKANNPDHSSFTDLDDDDPEPEVQYISPYVNLSVITTITSRMKAPSGLLFTTRAQKMPADRTDYVSLSIPRAGMSF